MTATLRAALDHLPAERIVAYDAAAVLTWAECAQRIAEIQTTLPHTPQRVLLRNGDPLPFTLHLLATLLAGHTPVLPPNFQEATLDELATQLDEAPLPATPAIELFTSGSSGDPKRIVKSIRQIEAECRVLEVLWGNRLGDATIVATVPPHHIYGLLFRLFWPLLAGRPFDTVTAGEPTTLYARLAWHRRCALVSSPAQLARLPELHNLADFPVRPVTVFSSGGPLAADVAQRFAKDWAAAPCEVFGSTETGGIAWRQQGGDSAWTPLPEVTISRDDDGALLVQSPFLANSGKQRMEDGIDLLTDGRFMLNGRLDRIVKIEEKRLSLPDLENRLATHPWVKTCTAAAIHNANARRTVVGALIVPTLAGWAAVQNNRRTASHALREHLAGHFDAILLPRRWRFVEALPYNERGKLPRDAVLALLNMPLSEEVST